MRARNIKPRFFKNYELAKCGPIGQLLFEGLWLMADREGRLHDRPEEIKAELFPYYKVNLEKELDGLVRAGFISRYGEGGGRYIQVVNFSKHQNPHPREPESAIPAQNGQAVELHGEALPGHVKALPGPADSLIPDSLIPSSLIPDSPFSSELPQKREASEDTFIEIAVSGGGKPYKLPRSQVEKWRALYPGVDVEVEIRKAKAWQEAPGNKNGKTNIGRFLVNWLNRAQDKSRGQHTGPSRSPIHTEQSIQRLAAQAEALGSRVR